MQAIQRFRARLPQQPVYAAILLFCMTSTAISVYFFYRAAMLPAVDDDGAIFVQSNNPATAGIPGSGIPGVVFPETELSQPVASSESRLGVFLLSSFSDGARRLMPLKPRVIKVMDPHISQSLLDAVMQYRSALPNGTVILRIAGRDPAFTLKDDPELAADTYYRERVAPALKELEAYKRFFTHIESPSGMENTPGWETVEEVTWNGRFWKRLVKLYRDAGYKACVGSIPAGKPAGSVEEIEVKMAAFLPALQAARDTGGALCYHAYSTEYGTDVGVENWWSLRHRILHMAYTKADPTLADLPVILSEAGVDWAGNAAQDGWQARGSESRYMQWLEWFDARLQEDPYVIGAALFQIGDSYWSSFDVEPVVWWLERQLAGAGIPTPLPTGAEPAPDAPPSEVPGTGSETDERDAS